MSLLRARGLCVGAPGLPALRHVDLDLAAGRVLGLVGESGAGKSMIGRAIAGLLPPGFSVSAGILAFDGRDLAGMEQRRRRALLGREIAFVPQEPMTALNPVLTIGAQFFEHLARLGIGDRRRMATAALAAVHLPEPAALLGRYPHQLSGGMCQRVLIAMAFAARPKLIVADEPTTALDVTVQARIVALMREMQAAHGTAVLFITHDLRLAATICDEVAVLYAGAVVERGLAAAVLGDPAHPYTRCLLLANPPLHGERRGLYALPKHMPGLRAIATLPGCRFAPRCPLAIPACTTADPAMRAVGAKHAVACIRFEETPGIVAPPPSPPASKQRAGNVLLELRGLGKRFVAGGVFGRRETVAVRGVDAVVSEGEFVAVVGESGSGKSTLGRLIAGLERPSEGAIVLAGRDVSRANRATRAHRLAHVQMVFQDPQSALNPRRRIASIATQAMEPTGASRAARDARAGELLTAMDLSPELAMRRPAQLSGGQRQRVNIARALCVLPRLLVADEIVSGLDVSVQAQLLTLLQRLRAEHGFALLLISHDLSVVRHLCDRVLVMRAGEVVETGPVASVFDHPQHEYTRALLVAVPGASAVRSAR